MSSDWKSHAGGSQSENAENPETAAKNGRIALLRRFGQGDFSGGSLLFADAARQAKVGRNEVGYGMSYFPFFMELEDTPCLVVGGGQVALRKIEKLLPFGAAITVVAPQFCAELAEMAGIQRICRAFLPADIVGMRCVIGATDDEAVNGEIAALCRTQHIPVNIVDDPAKCSFLFPALVQRGRLVVGISTGGASPLAAQYIRKETEKVIPDHFAQTLDFLAAQREIIRKRIPDTQKREAFLREIFALALEQEGNPGIEMEKLLEDRANETKL